MVIFHKWSSGGTEKLLQIPNSSIWSEAPSHFLPAVQYHRNMCQKCKIPVLWNNLNHQLSSMTGVLYYRHSELQAFFLHKLRRCYSSSKLFCRAFMGAECVLKSFFKYFEILAQRLWPASCWGEGWSRKFCHPGVLWQDIKHFGISMTMCSLSNWGSLADW